MTTTAQRRSLSPSAREEARRLYADGMTYTRIGQLLEVHSSTVWAALNPEKMRQRRAKYKIKAETPPAIQRKVGTCLPWEGVPDEDYI